MVKRDERKFAQADQDNDNKLSKEEFAAFLHPEEHEHMKDIVVLVSHIGLFTVIKVYYRMTSISTCNMFSVFL